MRLALLFFISISGAFWAFAFANALTLFLAIISEVTLVRKERDRRKRKVRKCELGKGMKMGLKMHELNVT